MERVAISSELGIRNTKEMVILHDNNTRNGVDQGNYADSTQSLVTWANVSHTLSLEPSQILTSPRRPFNSHSKEKKKYMKPPQNLQDTSVCYMVVLTISHKNFNYLFLYSNQILYLLLCWLSLWTPMAILSYISWHCNFWKLNWIPLPLFQLNMGQTW